MSNDLNPESRAAASARQVPVWDILVRGGHWLTVVLFFVAYSTEDDLLTLHSWVGYGVGIYLLVRIVWGFVGTKHARFADFTYGPSAALRYLGDLLLFRARRYLGHSPAGGLMVFALLASLSATTVSGIALLAVEENQGPLAPWLGQAIAEQDSGTERGMLASAHASEEERDEDHEHGKEGEAESEEALEEVHEFCSNLTLFLIVLHIGGVAVASMAHRENLVRAMVTGLKRAD